MIFTTQTTYIKIVENFLREINLRCDFVELFQVYTAPWDHALNMSIIVEKPRHPDDVYNRFTQIYRDLQKSSLTKKFRDRIEELENENEELKKRLSLKDRIICDTIEENEETVEVCL